MLSFSSSITFWTACGGVRTIQVKLARLGSMLPEVSVARTSKVWLSSIKPLKLTELAQEENPAPSRLHSKPATPTMSVPSKVNVIESESVDPPAVIASPFPSTAEVMVVSGEVVSCTVIVNDC